MKESAMPPIRAHRVRDGGLSRADRIEPRGPSRQRLSVGVEGPSSQQERAAGWAAMRAESTARVERHFATLAAAKVEKCRAAAEAYWQQVKTERQKAKRK